MTTEQPENAWGEPVEDEDPSDEYWVPEDEREDEDGGEGSVALGTTGDDMGPIAFERLAYERTLIDEAEEEEE